MRMTSLYRKPLARRTITIISGALLVVSVMSACGSSKGSSSSKTTASGGGRGSAPANTSPIKLGVLESVSGNLAAIGQAELDGYKSAAAYINANGGIDGRQITLDVLDDANDPGRATTQVQKLFNDKVEALLGPVSSTVTNAIGPLVQKQKIPNVVGGTVLDSQIKSLPYTVAFAFPATAEAPALMNYVKKHNITKVAFMATDTPTATNWLAAWKNIGGTSVDTEVFNNKGTDFTANAARAKASGAQMIFLVVGGTQTGIVLTNLQSVGFSGEIASYQGILSLPLATLTKLAGATVVSKIFATGGAGEALGANLPAGDPRIAQNQLFAKWFQQTIGSAPSEPGFSSEAWDSLMLLNQAAKNDPKSMSDGVAWNTAMHSLKNSAQTNASYTINPDTVYALTKDDVIYLRVQGGAWVASSE